MSLIAYGVNDDNNDQPEAVISNNSFWPDIDPANFRQSERIDGSVTSARLVAELSTAISDINRQLAQFQDEVNTDGIESIEDLATPPWAIANHYQNLYRRAVYATAKASLMERYRDISATGTGDELGEAKDLAADDYRRDARWAVSEIQGRPHSTVELI